MPPKDAKKGAAEDFSDCQTLPQANVFKFTLVQGNHLSLEARNKVKQAIKDKLVPSSQGRIQTLTREDIVTYGKGKGIILDQTQLFALPPEDPRKNLSEDDMIARSAADRMFELCVLVRRQRQQKIAAAGGDEDEPSDQVDGFIYMVDYPTTRAENFALSKYSQALHAVFEIEEIPIPVEEGEEEDQEQQEKEPQTPDSVEERKRSQLLVDSFISARADCDHRSGLRQLAMLKVPFINQAVNYTATNAEGVQEQKVRPSEDNFISELIAKGIDKYAQYFVQYLKFKKLVTVTPLVPDRNSLARIEELKREQKKNTTTLQDESAEQEQTIKELEASKEKEEDKEELARTEKELSDIKQRLSEMKERTEQRNNEISTELAELIKKSKRSLDDEEPAQPFDMSGYQNDFVQNAETANNISSVLSAMVSHIAHANKGEEQRPLSQNSTQEETDIDSLFANFEHQIKCDVGILERGDDPLIDTSNQPASTSNPAFGMQIHDSMNSTLEVKQTIPAGLADQEEHRLEQIAKREQQIYANLRVPGKNRDMMPSIPDKSQRRRDAENPAFYPFCTLPQDEAERMLELRDFQQLIKTNQIDQGKVGMNKHPKYQIFERCFENHMSMDIFSQVYADALLDEPEVVTYPYARKDSLLIALFNKQKPKSERKADQKFKHINARELPLQTDDADGEKNWRASYRVMPDFENWLSIFAEELVQEQEIQAAVQAVAADAPPANAPAKGGKGAPAADAPDPNVIPVTLMKYVLDEEALPSSLLNVEDAKIQQISEKSALMYPDDNSVIRVDHFSVGGQSFSKSVIIKDNFRFGLRSRAGHKQEEHTEYGLVRQIPIGDTEFYLHFENGTKMGIEQVQMQRNPQQTIQVPPPEPTPEEIAYKLEQQKKFQEAAAKAAKANKPPPTDIEIPKTPQPTWEEAPPNFLDTLYNDDDLAESRARTNLTFKNGLIVQYLGNGYVCQTHEHKLKGLEGRVEKDRLVTKDGIVIRQFANLDSELLFPDGVFAVFSREELCWTITNNKGMQRRFKDGVFTDVKPIPCAVETDAVSGASMMIREDEVVSVTYKDGSRYCQHRDGTKFHTSADGTEIRIEKRTFASNCVKINKSSNFDCPYNRALDKVVLETYLPDGSLSQTFLDNVSTKHGDQQTYRTMITRADLSVVISDALGHFSLITSNTRQALNDVGEKKKHIGENDCDYLTELQRQYGGFTPQVYIGHISSQPDESTIMTKNSLDKDNTQFILRSDMTIDKIINDIVIKTAKISDQEREAQRRKLAQVMHAAVEQQNFDRDQNEVEFEQIGGFIEPNTRSFVYPRLFVVHNDGTAKELLSRMQLDYEIRQKGLKPQLSIKQMMSDVVNNSFIENTYFLTKVINMEQIQIEQQLLNDVNLPQNARDALKGKLEQPDINLLVPRQQQYLFNQIFKMPDCEQFTQQAFASDFKTYKEWVLNNVRYETEFGIVHAPVGKGQEVDWEKIEDEESFNKRIGIKILKNRANPKQKFCPGSFKDLAMQEIQESASVKEFRSQNLTHTLNSSKEIIPQSQAHKAASPKKPQKQRTTYQQENAVILRNRFDTKLNDLAQMKEPNDFIPDYFGTDEGQQFLVENPPQPLSEEAKIRMQQRLERQHRSTLQQENQQNQEGDQLAEDEARDNPIVALEPDELKQGSHFTGSKKDRSLMQNEKSKLTSVEIAALPSLYMQEKMYLYDKEQEALLKAEEHHIVKTKDFNVYGRLREEKPFVKTITKSKAQSDLNEKFITTECITDRRVKISSQAPRFYMNAPSVEDVRKQGQHQMILGAIDKKQTFGELINQANSMVTSVLHDNLKRSLQIMPSEVRFGHIRPGPQGTFNDVTISIKNEDSIAHRITIKPINDVRIAVRQEQYGIIAPGMTKQVVVSIRVKEDENPAQIKETILINSKHEIFKIPLTATIVSNADFDDLNQQELSKTGKSCQNARVRERMIQKTMQEESMQQPSKVVLTSLPAREEEEEEQDDM